MHPEIERNWGVSVSDLRIVGQKLMVPEIVAVKVDVVCDVMWIVV